MTRGGWDGAGDVIRLTGVRGSGRHGVLDFEKVEPQPFVVDVTMWVDTQPAHSSDDLADTVNYGAVAADVVAIIEGPHVDLIERLAGLIADAVLARDLVEQVEVCVHKPEAPVGVPFGDVTVAVTRSDVRRAVVALGSNEGDSLGLLTRAVAELGELPRTAVRALSPLVLTDPVGGPEQPDYLNAVAIIDTTLRPKTLLRRLHEIEARHGRTREVRWGQRTLDLDLIQYGDPDTGTDVTYDTEHLTLPHPRAHERGFVLLPWLLAQPGAVLRRGGAAVPVTDLLRALPGATHTGAPSGTDADIAVQGVRPGPSWPASVFAAPPPLPPSPSSAPLGGPA